MSIATRTGDGGTTALMYGRRVGKSHLRVEAYGTVDEFSAFLGVARAALTDPWVKGELEKTQQELIGLMGELAVAKEDWERYQKEGYSILQPIALERVDRGVEYLESQLSKFTGWVLPGRSVEGAHLEVARVVCRRAERRIVALRESEEIVSERVLPYLNRVADFLWLAARFVEKEK